MNEFLDSLVPPLLVFCQISRQSQFTFARQVKAMWEDGEGVGQGAGRKAEKRKRGKDERGGVQHEHSRSNKHFQISAELLASIIPCEEICTGNSDT